MVAMIGLVLGPFTACCTSAKARQKGFETAGWKYLDVVKRDFSRVLARDHKVIDTYFDWSALSIQDIAEKIEDDVDDFCVDLARGEQVFIPSPESTKLHTSFKEMRLLADHLRKTVVSPLMESKNLSEQGRLKEEEFTTIRGNISQTLQDSIERLRQELGTDAAREAKP
jgi:hypothetical protein